MANSNQLRDIIKNNAIVNSKSQDTENNVFYAGELARAKLFRIYPNFSFTHERLIKKRDINSKIRFNFSDQFVGTNISSDESFIAPDGGFIFVIAEKSKKRLLIGTIEAKTQGTNDLRKLEGKGEQSRGNAIERAYKNYTEIVNYQKYESIFPYLIVANGCDLEDKNSSIRDRLTAMNLSSPFNKLYIHNIKDRHDQLHPRASIFIGIKNVNEMSDIIFGMLEISFKYYYNKYKNEFANSID